MPVRDLLIVGAGPSGLATAIAAKQHGLDYAIVDKGVLVNSIYQLPATHGVLHDAGAAGDRGTSARHAVRQADAGWRRSATTGALSTRSESRCPFTRKFVRSSERTMEPSSSRVPAARNTRETRARSCARDRLLRSAQLSRRYRAKICRTSRTTSPTRTRTSGSA